MTQFGQHPSPTHVIAHLSDTHFLGGERPLYGKVRTHENLLRALAQLEQSGARPEAIVFTGDLADLAEPDAYVRLREIVEPAAERMGAQIVWVMGNHDERLQFATQLLGDVPAGVDVPSQDRVYHFGGLRIIVLDSTVPGYHHGDLADDQLVWLARELDTPAPHGTLLALHHPPIPTPLALMALLELRGQDRLAGVIRGTDVRGILAGHLHYTTHSLFAGVPVSVAAATCYTMDLSAPVNHLSGVDGSQAFNLVHVYDDQIVHSVVPIGVFPEVTGFTDVFLEQLSSLTPAERLEAFSRKVPPPV
ncbi:phosphodiesterase [Lacisediminihabitans profunda]|uniref:Phosphodiesterase n=1 Tax=Lacisediminihabitans profunda TaxID=2594790 RepID=A0A5C8UQL8_9MICO|nr:phosphodiesterase [Lacisediminihabitans profunda]TXN29759.1 phosphodiesterase [Lacisediminihabitans profunda]